MRKFAFLFFVMSLGACLVLGGCGGEDDGENGGRFGSCAGGDLPLAGGCYWSDGGCTELYGTVDDIEAMCAENDAIVVASCPASSKESGGCVYERDGGVGVVYLGDVDPTAFRNACEDEDGDCYFGG